MLFPHKHIQARLTLDSTSTLQKKHVFIDSTQFRKIYSSFVLNIMDKIVRLIYQNLFYWDGESFYNRGRALIFNNAFTLFNDFNLC